MEFDFDKIVQMYEEFKKDLASFWEISCKHFNLIREPQTNLC